MDKLQLVVLPGSNPCEQLRGFYEKAYSCWKETWENAAKEVPELPAKRDSSEFIRQDEIIALFSGRECTSMGFWTELDFTYRSSREDFYFRNWTDLGLRKLVRDGKWVGMYSYLTVCEKFRKSRNLGVSFKDLQIGIFVMRFLNSEMNAMTGCTRNNRGVNSVCQRGGATYLEKGLIQYGCETDLMAWYKGSCRPWEGVRSLVEKLWIKRIDFKNLNPGVGDLYLRLCGDLGLQNPARGVRSFLSSKGS